MIQRYDDPRRTGRDAGRGQDDPSHASDRGDLPRRYSFQRSGHPDRPYGGEKYQHGARGRYAASRYGQAPYRGREGDSTQIRYGQSRYGERPQVDERGRHEQLSRQYGGAGDWQAPRAEAGAGRGAARGPKGYQRSDERIKEDVCERLAGRADLDSSEVTVEAKSATVILEGTVPERWMKHAMEDIADHCLGVKDVDNRVRVQYPGTTVPVSEPRAAESEAAERGESRTH